MENFLSAEAVHSMMAQGNVAVVEEPPAPAAKPKKASGKKVHMIVSCPPRAGFSGFYAVGRFFPAGDTEDDFPEEVAATLEAECRRGETILTLRFQDGRTVSPSRPRSLLSPGEERAEKLRLAAEVKAKRAAAEAQAKAETKARAMDEAVGRANVPDIAAGQKRYAEEEAEADRLLAESSGT